MVDLAGDDADKMFWVNAEHFRALLRLTLRGNVLGIRGPTL